MDLTIDRDRFFRKLTLQVAGCLEIETAVQRCLDMFSTIMPVDFIAFHRYDHTTGTLHTLAMATPQGIQKAGHRFVIPESYRQEIAQRWAERVWIFDRFADDPLAAGAAAALGFARASGMLMDLTLGGRQTGVVSVANRQDYYYTRDHAALLTSLNEPLALAFINGMRFKALASTRDLLEQDNRILKDELDRATTRPVIGARQGLKPVMQQIGQVGPADSPVLLLGETGTGKEVIARAIHEISPRRHHPFISVNCGALSRGLVDSELFGHEKGAFTGALKQHKGYFERADRGTLFLDEVGELSPDIQVRLLRVLQEKEIDRVGSRRPIRVDTRFIAATNRNLEALVSQGRFRQDLYFRIRVFPIHLPPLRNRKDDIPDLVRYFTETKSRALNKFPIPNPSPATIKRLEHYDWPGNVRELENLVERALILHQSGPLVIEPLHSDLTHTQEAVTENQPPLLTLEQVTKRHIRRMLDMAGGRVEGRGGAAELLDINPSTLRVRMRKLNIAFGRNYRPISENNHSEYVVD